MRRIGTIGVILATLVLLAACGKTETPEPPSSASGSSGGGDCTLTMGWDPWEPYHYLSPTGEIWGFDVQLVRAIGEQAGCDIEFSRDNWPTLLEKVSSGEVDFICGATLTPEREAVAYFSNPYRSEDFVLYVRSGDVSKWKGDSLRALLEAGMRIGVTDAYVYGDEITALQDDPQFADSFVLATAGDVNATRLLDGVIDGYVEDIFVATASIRRRGLEEQVAVHPLTLKSTGQVRFMFSRASTSEELVDLFNQALEEIEASGQYKEIENQYLR